VLWSLPLFAAPLLFACPLVPSELLFVLVGGAGFLLGMTLPILVSYGQRLMPEGQRVASSITMGVTWGLAGALVAVTMAGCNHALRPDLAFVVFAAGALLSSVLCAWLPVPESLARLRSLAVEGSLD
jgi:FSR family fosmidomycin resistance protein-like MFS transporter